MSIEKNKAQEVYRFSNSVYGSHRKIIDCVGKNKKVLDVGCNKGYLGSEFKKNGCYIVGIEPDPGCARIAAQFCDKVIQADVEGLEGLDYPENYFDVMVFADILEHLKAPQETLLRLKKYLNPKGFIIASLPNVARLDIRLKLLFGKFEYSETGIMDKTHLRFFTVFTARKIFVDCGYQISRIYYTGALMRFKIFPGCFAFQFIILARKT